MLAEQYAISPLTFAIVNSSISFHLTYFMWAHIPLVGHINDALFDKSKLSQRVISTCMMISQGFSELRKRESGLPDYSSKPID
jgi:hypothetical protein